LETGVLILVIFDIERDYVFFLLLLLLFAENVAVACCGTHNWGRKLPCTSSCFTKERRRLGKGFLYPAPPTHPWWIAATSL
jgi:hypothetical protein